GGHGFVWRHEENGRIGCPFPSHEETENENESEVRWLVGHNMPGYLPDSTPTEHETFDEAKRALIEDMLFHADYAPDDTADELANAAQDVNLWSERDSDMRDYGRQSISAGGFEWWIAREGEA